MNKILHHNIIVFSLLFALTGCSNQTQPSKIENEIPISNNFPPVEIIASCPAIKGAEYGNWKCYEMPKVFTFLHPQDWMSSGQGDAGFFSIGKDINGSITYEDLNYMEKGGVDALIQKRNKGLCGQTDACPQLMEKIPAMMGVKNVTLYHYRIQGLSLDNPQGHLDQYEMGFVEGDKAYFMSITIPSTVSSKETSQRLKEFSQVAKSFTLNSEAGNFGPLTLEDIQKRGISSLQKITLQRDIIYLTPQQEIKDGKIVYPPVAVNIREKFTLGNDLEIRIENHEAIIKLKDRAWKLANGQTLNLETNEVEGKGL